MTEPAISLTGVSRSFDIVGGHAVLAVDGVSLEIAPGESVGLIGESGSGKSTIARLVLGLIPPDAGTIRIAGTRLDTSRPAELKRLRGRVGAVFQEPYESLNPRMRIFRIVEEPLRIHRRSLGREERAELVLRALSHVGLPDYMASRYPHALSGGEQQRVGIARALVTEPELIVLDEPTSSLDLSVRAQVLTLLRELRDRLGVTYLYISHDMDTVSFICDEIAVLYSGRIVEHGTTQQVLEDPRHPYTRALVSSRLSVVPGARQTFVDLHHDGRPTADRRHACVLAGACPIEIARCTEQPVELLDLGLGRKVACIVEAQKEG